MTKHQVAFIPLSFHTLHNKVAAPHITLCVIKECKALRGHVPLGLITAMYKRVPDNLNSIIQFSEIFAVIHSVTDLLDSTCDETRKDVIA